MPIASTVLLADNSRIKSNIPSVVTMLEGREYLRGLALVGAVGAAAFVGAWGYRKLSGGNRINHKIAMDQAKVTNTIDIEELGDVTAFCRCWKSSKFPYCDGSHNKHNKCTGDNVGPILMNRKTETS